MRRMKFVAWVALALVVGLMVGGHLVATRPAFAALARYDHLTKLQVDTLRVTGAIVSAGTDSVGGAATVGGALTVTGAVTGASFAGAMSGAVTATTITASSTTVLSGAFDARSTTELAGAVVCSSTVEVQGTASFADSTYFGDDVVATTFTGALTGAVTGDVTGNVSGNTSTLFQAVAYKGNLPTAGDNTGEFFKNTVGDSGWVADNDSWVQLWP